IETEIIAAIYEREGLTTGALDVTLDQRLSIGQFYGFEINWWPARIAEVAMFLVDHQANQALASRIGLAPERLPIKITAHIVHGNALHMAWDTTVPRTPGMTYVFGNPPFIGHQTKNKEQVADLKQAWGKNYDGYLDYVTAWHAKTLDLLRHRGGEFGYVTTNSICQGQPVPALFDPIYFDGWNIKFAHRTFAWDSEAPGKAAVHCVIVGFTRDKHTKQRLWDYPDITGEPVPVAVEKGVNAYLIDGPQILVWKTTKAISPEVSRASFGTMPVDGGNLLVEKDDYAEVDADPVAAKYLRPFRGARELVHDLDRWCLWMGDEDFNPADIAKSPVLKQRVASCKEWRSQQKPTGDAFKLKDTPHLFRPNSKRPLTDYVCIPRVVSENRKYFLADHYTANIIASDATFTISDPDGLMFALLSSSMFITWQRAVGGRLKSDLRFSATLVWNTFPVPELTEKQRQEIIAGGKAVLEARALHPERSLADHYNPLAMDPALLKAHDKLDRAVDKALGASRKLTTEEQRLEILFKNYADLTGNESL
ncbi:DNA methyltransferase, partial [Corynebacterium mendelii]